MQHPAEPNAKGRHALWWLIGLGIGSGVIYLMIRHLTDAFAFGAPQQGRPLPLVLLLFGGAFVLYLSASRIAARAMQQTAAVGIIVVFAVLFRGILLWSEPIQEVDIYRYLWDGAVTCQGVSPFLYAPETVLQTVENDQTPADLARIVQLRRDPTMASILLRVHWREIPTVYPPISQAVFATVHRITPQGSSLPRRLFVMRTVLVLFDLATIGIVLAMLRLADQPLGWVVAYAWCPLLLKECANSGHLDSIVVLITMAGIYLLVRAVRGLSNPAQLHGGPWLGMLAGSVLLAAGVGAKIYPLALLPWLAAASFQRRWGYVTGVGSFLLCTLIVICPMLPPTFLGISWLPATADGQRNGSGLATFAKYWEINDLLFLVCVENLKPDAWYAPQAWFAVVPDSWRVGLANCGTSLFDWPPRLAPFFWARTLTTMVFGVMAIWLALAARSANTPESWLRAAFLTIAWFWLLSPTQNPWYWTWALPLLPFARGRAWWAVSGLVFVYYLRFWLEYEFPQPPVAGTDYNGTQFFDFVVTWLEFGPWLAWLTVANFVRRRPTA